MTQVNLRIEASFVVMGRINYLNLPVSFFLVHLPHKFDLERAVGLACPCLRSAWIDHVVGPGSIAFKITPPDEPHLVFLETVFHDAVAMFLGPRANGFVCGILAVVNGLGRRWKSHIVVGVLAIVNGLGRRWKRHIVVLS